MTEVKSVIDDLNDLIELQRTRSISGSVKDELYSRYCTKTIPKIKRKKSVKDWSKIKDLTDNIKLKFPDVDMQYMPYYFLCNLKGHKQKIQNKDSDVMALCYANEGGGKTTIGYLACCAVDPTFTSRRAIFTEEQFKELIKELIKEICDATETESFDDARYKIALDPSKYKYLRGRAILLDEGVDLLLTRNAMTKGNKDMITFFTIMRILGLFVWINAVNYALIEKDVRTRRAKMSIVVTKKGVFKALSRKRQRKIKYKDTTKEVTFPRSPLMETFPKLEGKEWAEYERVKAEFVSKKGVKVEQEPDNDFENKKQKPLSPKQMEVLDLLKKGFKPLTIADQMQISNQAVYGHMAAIKKKGFQV